MQRAVALVTLLVASVSFAPLPGLAQDGGRGGVSETRAVSEFEDPAVQAKLHYDDAVLLYEDQDFVGAAQALERAFDLDPHAVLAYNIARAYDDAGQLRDARRWYTKSLEMDGLGDAESDRAEVAIERIANTEARLADRVDALTPETESRLQVTSSAGDARVYLGDRLVGFTPIAITVESATYEIRVEADGFEPYAETVQIGVAESVVVRAALEAESLLPWTYGLAGASLAALAVGIAGDVLAVQAYDDAKAAVGDASRVAELKSDGEAFRAMGVTGYSVAGAFAIASVVVLLVDVTGDQVPGDYGTFGALDVEVGPTPTGGTVQVRW